MAIGLFWNSLVMAQSNVQVNGSAGVTTELYQFNPSDSTMLPRRPDFNYRIFFNPTVRIGDKVSIPFELYLTKRQPNAMLPLSSSRSLTDLNNRIGIHPTFGWATFHAGTHEVQFSELSTGDLPVFGWGVDFRPGKFRVAYSQGLTRSVFEGDTTLNLRPQWQQKIQALKIGSGSKEGSFWYANIVKRSDDMASLTDAAYASKATEGLLFTTDFQLRLASRIIFNGEIGSSAFTRDLSADSLADHGLSFMPASIFQVNQSTRADAAGKGKLDFNYEQWGLSLQAKYLGPGYEPLGYAFMETDVFDLTISPRLRLFNNRFTVNASVGQRRDNLADTKLATTKRLIALVNTNIVLDKFSFSAQYNNYGMRNNVDNDTLKLEFVSSNFSVTPSYRFKSDNGAFHSCSVSFNKSVFEDKNLLTGTYSNNNTTSINGHYNLVFKQLNAGAAISFMDNKRINGDFHIFSGSLRFGHSFFERKLNVNTSVGYSLVQHSLFTSDNRFFVRPSVRYKLENKTELFLNGNFRLFKYGSQREGVSFSESLVRLGARASF